MAQPAGSVNDKNWKDLIRPNRPVVEHDRDAQRKAKLVIEPTTGLSESTVEKAAANISEKANVRFKAVWIEVEK